MIKPGLKYFTYDDIKSWNPCYDPIKFISKDWKGTAIDILNLPEVEFKDKLWVVLRTEILSDKTLRLFAVWCYRQTLIFLPNQDPRSIEAANVAEKFALGLASQEELKTAAESAWSAAASAAESAAELAARSAELATWSAAELAARSTAWAAAELAARSAARSAAWSAARSTAWSAARSAAWAAAESAQQEKLKELILEEEKND